MLEPVLEEEHALGSELVLLLGDLEDHGALFVLHLAVGPGDVNEWEERQGSETRAVHAQRFEGVFDVGVGHRPSSLFDAVSGGYGQRGSRRFR